MAKQIKDAAAIERLASETILQRGVKVKVAAPGFIRWFRKTITLKVGSPFQGTLFRVSSYYLSTGLTSEKLDGITIEESLVLMQLHGKAISKAVACAMLNGYWSGMLLTRPLARYLRWHTKPQELFAITTALLIYGGTADFMNTTRLVRQMKATRPNLRTKTGQQTKES